MSDLVARAQRLLEANQYLTLATADSDGRPWSSTVFSAASLAAGGGPWTRAQVSSPARPRLWVARPVAAYVLGGGSRDEVPLAERPR